MSSLRWPALVLLPALLVGAVVIDRNQRPEPEPVAETTGVGVATLAPADALSSVWYCPAASISPDDQLVIHNLTDRDRVGRLTLLAAPVAYADGQDTPAESSIELDAGATTTLTPATVWPDDVPLAAAIEEGEIPVAAMIEFEGGGITVENRSTLRGVGSDNRPCSTEASDGWWFPIGATVSDAGVSGASQQFVLLNPFPDPAVLDITFDTSNGPREPSAYEGLVVAGRSARTLLVDDEVANVERASASVVTRSGRLIVDRVLAYDASVERRGLSVSAGSSRPDLELWLPEGDLTEGHHTSIVVTNPGEDPAEVDIEIYSPEAPIVEPFERTVPAGRSVEVVLRSDVSPEAIAGPAGGGRVLDGVRTFSAVVRSVNGVPVVAERRDLVVASPGVTPGLSTTMATPVTATSWVVDLAAADAAASALVIANPNFDSIVTATVSTPDGDELLGFEVAQGGRTSIALTELGDARVVRIESSLPVAVERSLVGLRSRSTSLAVAVASAVAADVDG